MNENFEINKEIVFSTSHISQDTDKEIEKSLSDPTDENPMTMLSIIPFMDYGWMIFVPEDKNDLPHFDKHEELGVLIECAKENGCTWLRLDADGPVYQSFQIFEWK